MPRSEKPILFSGPMVRAILAGTKTQTRRVVKPPHDLLLAGGAKPEQLARVPFEKGMLLWVRETWQEFPALSQAPAGIGYRADIDHCGQVPVGGSFLRTPRQWTPSIYMKRNASRLTLEVASVRAERLQSITAKDIIAEGAVLRSHHTELLGKQPVSAFDGCAYIDLKSLWVSAWDSINGKRPGCAWKDDPLVWVVEFRRVELTHKEERKHANG